MDLSGSNPQLLQEREAALEKAKTSWRHSREGKDYSWETTVKGLRMMGKTNATMKSIWVVIVLLILCASAPAQKPNVLFISIDDLNDWTGTLKGHPQAITPNLDRLCDQGMVFT